MNSKQLTVYDGAAAFLAATQSYLEREEAINGLMLGVAMALQNRPERLRNRPYLAAVYDGPDLAACALMTPPRKLILYSHQEDCTEAMQLIARDLLARQRTIPAVLGPDSVADTFATVWAELTGRSHRPGMWQRVYELRQVVWPEKMSKGVLRAAAADDVELLMEWALAFHAEALSQGEEEAADAVQMRVLELTKAGNLYVWDDEGVVSMAAVSRPTRHGITVGLVYTPSDKRQRGYASACVAHLSQKMLDEGWQYVTLFTDLGNPTSNHIYQAIGYRPCRNFNEYIFPLL